MQKWIGVGRIDSKPELVTLKYKENSAEALLVWVRCTRAWDASKNDAIPTLWLGKRKELMLKYISASKQVEDSLVYVTGEISSRLVINNGQEMNLGLAVFGASITFWTTESIEKMEKKVNQEDSLIGSSLEELEVK